MKRNTIMYKYSLEVTMAIAPQDAGARPLLVASTLLCTTVNTQRGPHDVAICLLWRKWLNGSVARSLSLEGENLLGPWTLCDQSRMTPSSYSFDHRDIWFLYFIGYWIQNFDQRATVCWHAREGRRREYRAEVIEESENASTRLAESEFRCSKRMHRF